MKKIPETFMHEGRRFELEQRTDHVALYRQIHLTYGLIAYEVHIIRVRPAQNIRGVSYEPSERLAGNSNFGYYAWSFGGPNKRELALEKFNALQQRLANDVPARPASVESPPSHGWEPPAETAPSGTEGKDGGG